jgi:hypothetical protein
LRYRDETDTAAAGEVKSRLDRDRIFIFVDR